MEYQRQKNFQEENREVKKKSIYTMTPKTFNPNARPFQPSNRQSFTRFQESRDTITVGPSQVPVNAKIWRAIASDRILPELSPITNGGNHPIPSTSPIASPQAGYSDFMNSSAYTSHPPAFQVDYNRDCIVFRREFGPVATNEGVELRLKHGVRVFISLDGAVLLECGDIRIAASANGNSTAVEHPMGRMFQQLDHVDIIAFDGTGNNNFIRYSKIWKDCISLTAEGLILIYLVDTAGMRTTSDQVNRDWRRDYCKQVYFEGMAYRSQIETHIAAEHYRYRVEQDGTDVFVICNVKVSQAQDGMVRVEADPFSIRTSIENRSITLKTPRIHCTASIGSSPHLFIRINERRVHFDGTNFVVRNMGHSSSFDGENNLRIH